MKTINYIAIDISKSTLQIQTQDTSRLVPYDLPNLRNLIAIARKLENPVVACEATGGYERFLLATLSKAGIPATLINPSRVRAFAKSEGLLAKTDYLDAKVLLRFAQERNPRIRKTNEPLKEKLTMLMDRRSQLSDQLTQEKNRSEKAQKWIQSSINRSIRFLKKEILSIEQKIREIIQENQVLHDQDTILRSIKGVGETTSWTILAYLSEITQIGRNQLIALAGVAPYNRDSGKQRGKRSIHAGRAKVRKCLFMAARSAAVYNPVIKKYVSGLRARGKPYKCALVAAMRKMLIHMQSSLKNNQISLAT